MFKPFLFYQIEHQKRNLYGAHNIHSNYLHMYVYALMDPWMRESFQAYFNVRPYSIPCLDKPRRRRDALCWKSHIIPIHTVFGLFNPCVCLFMWIWKERVSKHMCELNLFLVSFTYTSYKMLPLTSIFIVWCSICVPFMPIRYGQVLKRMAKFVDSRICGWIAIVISNELYCSTWR